MAETETLTKSQRAWLTGAQPYCGCRPVTARIHDGRVVCAFCLAIYTPVSFPVMVEVPVVSNALYA
mgnify:CR=1 FL=1